MAKKLRVFELSPSTIAGVDTILYHMNQDESWQTVLQQIELELDNQFASNEDEGKDGWEGVEVKIKCSLMSMDEFNELTEA